LNNYMKQMRAFFCSQLQRNVFAEKNNYSWNILETYYDKNDDEYPLCKLMNYHNIEVKEALCLGTMENYFTTQKYLEKYLKERIHITDVLLHKIIINLLLILNII
jgi:hypothetical protein